jgi:hypothetical protein
MRNESVDGRGQLTDRLHVRDVVRPTAIAAIRYKAGLLENPQMKREERLRDSEGIGQFAYATFFGTEVTENADPRLVSNCLEPLRHGNGDVSCSHAGTIHQWMLMGQETGRCVAVCSCLVALKWP